MATSVITGLTTEQELQRQRQAHDRGQSVFDVAKQFVDPTDPLAYLGPASKLGKFGLGLFGASLALTPTEAEASIIGPKAKTWHKTGGMFTDPFNRQVKEISDANAMLDLGNLEKLKAIDDTTLLGDILKHPELFAAYPELANYPVRRLSGWERLDGIQGAFNPQDKMFKTNTLNPYFTDEEKLKQTGKITSTFLHEVNHAIQEIEGLSKGANTAMTTTAGQKKASKVYDSAVKTYKKDADEYFLKMGVEKNQLNEARYALEDAADILNGLSTDSWRAKRISNAQQVIENADPELTEIIKGRARLKRTGAKLDLKDKLAKNRYENVGGEAMARAVQKRFEEPWRIDKEPFVSSYDKAINELTYKPSMWNKK